MYAGYFGLRQTPFSIAPDPHYLFMSERHREALAHLLYGVQGGGGFVLLTGEIGAGKTTVCRAFLEQVPSNCRVAYIFNPKLTVGDLLRTICHEFHVEVRRTGSGPATIKDHLDPLNAYLLDCHAQGQQNLLIIDEAQSLTPYVLEQLRLLTNLETHERKLLQIVLIGQPELRQQLARPELEQLAQRVIARFHLGALSEGETRQYVAHRMAVAGHTGPLPFSEAALTCIHAITKGVPRRINLLCDRALLGAYASEQREVSVPVVERAAQEVFDVSVAAAQTTPVAVQKSNAWAAMGLGAIGGGVVLVLAALLLWQWPTLLQGLVPSSEAPSIGTPTGAVASATAPIATAPGAAADSTPTAPVSKPVAAIATTEPALQPNVTPTPPATAGATTPHPSPDEPPLQGTLPAGAALLANEAAGWRALGPLWGQSLEGENPCASAQQQRLQCFRTARMTVHGLRQLDRPGILTLRLPEGPARVLITRLHGDEATLQAGEQRWRVSLNTLGGAWRGEYATLWRTPPGSTGRISSLSTGPAARWLEQKLGDLQTAGQLPAQATGAAQRLQAFQQAQGIDASGNATPLTFMQVNRLSGEAEPRLSTP